MLAASGLRPEELETPEGRGAVWDGRRYAEDLDDVTDSVHAVVATATIVPFATWVPLSAYSAFMLVGTRQGPAVGLRAPPAS